MLTENNQYRTMHCIRKFLFVLARNHLIKFDQPPVLVTPITKFDIVNRCIAVLTLVYNLQFVKNPCDMVLEYDIISS